MRARIFRCTVIVFLSLFCYGIDAQTTLGFSFSSPQKINTGSANPPADAVTQAATDINGDGNTDLVVSFGNTSGTSYQNSILMGDGKGGFVLKNSNLPSPGFTTTGSYIPWMFVDMNRDGYPDEITFEGGCYPKSLDPVSGCVTSGSQLENAQINVYLGDGRGNFTLNPSATVQLPPATTFSSAIGDLNQDGLQDVAMLTFYNCDCAPQESNLTIFLNNGDGTFTALPVNNMYISLPATNLVEGDFNGDGKMDLALLGKASSVSAPGRSTYPLFAQVLYGNGDGSFQIGPAYQVDTGMLNLLASDLNNDGKTDLVVLALPQNAQNAPYRIVTLLAKQSGGFYWYSEVPSPASAYPNFIGLMDLNQDGNPDLAYYSYDSSTDRYSLRAWPGLGGGKFGTSSLIRTLIPLAGAQELENDIIAPLQTGGPPDILYALSYPPYSDVYLYEMLNQSN